MALSQSTVLKLYNSVIDDVITSVRDAFLDEGVDEQVLQEMKQIWTNKLLSSKAVEITQEPPEPQPPPLVAHNKANGNKAKSRAENNSNQNQTVNGTNVMKQQQQQQQQQPVVTTQSNQISQQTITSSKQNVVHHHQQQQQQLPQTVASAQPDPPQQQQQPPQQQQQQQHIPNNAPSAAVASLDPNKIVPIQITLPAQTGVPNSQARVLTIQVPASALQENQLQQVLTGPVITSIMPLPPDVASNVLQQHVNAVLYNQMTANSITLQKQMDGTADTSDEDGSDASDDNIDGDDDDDDPDKDDEDADGEGGAEEEPLNSEDDVTDEDSTDLFETENVVVCQYDKITRSRNKWKFYLKDGIMNLGGKDFIFQKSNGDAEW